jgi:hypothetical protein
MKKEFIDVLEKYFFDFNTYEVRKKLRNEIRNLFDRRFLGKVIDKTTPDDIRNTNLPNIVIQMLGYEFTLEEYSQFMNLYEN